MANDKYAGDLAAGINRDCDPWPPLNRLTILKYLARLGVVLVESQDAATKNYQDAVAKDAARCRSTSPTYDPEDRKVKDG